MEYVDHDLKALMDDMGSKRFTMGQVKCLMRQLLSAVEYLHDNWVVHRDIKTSNLLFNNRGILKLCDFGLAREYSSPIRPMTQMVVTLWYRAPELLLGATVYGPAIDIWSVGCVFAELLNGKPLFDGHGELEQLNKVRFGPIIYLFSSNHVLALTALRILFLRCSKFLAL
jgi:cell division cycle 2-like protein